MDTAYTIEYSDAKGLETGDNELLSLGYEPTLSRNRSTLYVAFMSFVLAAIPMGLGTTLFYPLNGGGPVDVIWGWGLVSVVIVCVSLSLGEITSVYPTAGGVYYQAFMLAPPRWRRITGWICGWMYLIGNVTITLSVNFVAAQFFIACINIFSEQPSADVMAGSDYQVYLIFLGITLFVNAISALGNAWLPQIDTLAIFATIAGVVGIATCTLAIAKNGRHSAQYVFTHFEASSGWPSGWSFCVGLLHAAYATSSTGMIISMCEEVRKPSIQVPRAMLMTVFTNTFVGFLFLIPLTFVLPDIQELLALPSGQPLPTILKSAVGSSGGTFALLVPLLVLVTICGIDCTTATSRCIFALGRDNAIPKSLWWVKINSRLQQVPLNAMMLSMVVQLALGLIYFGSKEAFNAFSGVGVICLTVSYTIPIFISLCTGRKQVKTGQFYFGAIGTVANVVAIVWAVLAVPLFCMPASIPVTASTVNYAPVVFVFAILLSTIWFWVSGRKNFTGPPTLEDPN